MGRPVLVAVILLTACAPPEPSTAPSPTLIYAYPSFAPGVPATPGSELPWTFAWMATCIGHRIGVKDFPYPCDPQPVTVTVLCFGMPCTVEPPEALTEEGAHFDGTFQHVQFRPLEVGLLTMRVTMHRDGTAQSASHTESQRVVDPE